MVWSKDQQSEYHRRWRRRHREKLKRYKRSWYLTNKERVLAVNQAYREIHTEKITQMKKDWGQSQKGEIAAKKRRAKWLLRAGWSKEEYERRVVNGCEICRRVGIELVFDHDHNTNVVRGLLCRRCNVALEWALEHYEEIGCYHRFSMVSAA